jgi:hypothetical protein
MILSLRILNLLYRFVPLVSRLVAVTLTTNAEFDKWSRRILVLRLEWR